MIISQNPVSSESVTVVALFVLHCIPLTPGGAVEHARKCKLNEGGNGYFHLCLSINCIN